MTPKQALEAPLWAMDEVELRYAYAYCEGEVRKLSGWSTTMDRFEIRRQEVAEELSKRSESGRTPN